MPGLHPDEQGLKAHGAHFAESDRGQTVQYKGWTIQACSKPITRDADMDAFAAKVGTPNRLPEQLYGDNLLRVTHQASGISIAFNAHDALSAWNQDNLPPLQVRQAQAWQRSRQKELQSPDFVTFKYDCEIKHSKAGQELWRETDQAMDKTILMQRDPILYFADLPLYESELDDCGASELTVKVRLMPNCLFVLLRFWLRVDGTIVRLRDTRYLCRFGSGPPDIVREILHFEATSDLMARAGSSDSHNPFTSAQTTAELFQAMAPNGTKFFRTDVCTLSPQSRNGTASLEDKLTNVRVH